ncbi:hypothetical protein [Kitasatospora sp. NPDC004289]
MIANGPAPTPEPLPVREKYTPAEMAVFERWCRQHGDDPSDWPDAVRKTYANTIANMRAGGQL